MSPQHTFTTNHHLNAALYCPTIPRTVLVALLRSFYVHLYDWNWGCCSSFFI